ncbi:hypothetical protein EV198_2431 [Roseivirga ehrenbergii]|uniref:Lipoprotein n=1 Tax=Roseivirga ehrenbergii (strain DSM 102268 / JCM 13514 / KCTC 12282 / NCIMB 14502 / KMM 6017) TaxID=279360 RepID=A0A150XT13_ROSEK|nr:hypothetical protein [Roseivirga ehrenbergii]KYG81834.1 hypothetical protein MB14_00105 [Roseivirga ehrenbergii]TCL01643.1 hypothetical protein EV198_2431 [Roseivirga ehrenbergii]
MKKLFVLALLTLGLFSCGNENPSQVYREFQKDRKLGFIAHHPSDPQIPVVSEGEHLVFKYTYVHEEDENIADDELSEIFYLEIPKGLSSFTYNSTNEGENGVINVAYRKSCYCGFSEYTLEKAIISASKINDYQWQISFDVIFKDDHNQESALKDVGRYTLNTDEYF